MNLLHKHMMEGKEKILTIIEERDRKRLLVNKKGKPNVDAFPPLAELHEVVEELKRRKTANFREKMTNMKWWSEVLKL